MDQTLDAGFDLDEGAKVHEARHGAGDALADDVAVGHGVPWLRLQLLQPERDAAAFGIDLEHLDLELLADCEHIFWAADAAPGEIADVQQAIDSAQIDERAIRCETADRAAEHVAFVDRRIDAGLRCKGLFLRDDAAVDYDIFLGGVQLDDAAGDLRAHQLLHLGGFADAAAGCRHKGAHADIDAESAFHQCGHCADDGRLLCERLFQRRPVRDGGQPVQGECVVALFVAALGGDAKRIARRNRIGIVREGGAQQDTLCLVADVEIYRVVRNRHDSAFQLFCPVVGLVGVATLKLRKQIAKGFGRFGGCFGRFFWSGGDFGDFVGCHRVSTVILSRLLLSGLSFRQPAASQLLCGNAGHVRLDVQNRRSVQHIDAAHMECAPFAAKQFHDGEADGIGAARRTGSKDTVRPVVRRPLAEEVETLGAVKRPQNEQVREALNVREALLKLGQYVQHAVCVVLCAETFGNSAAFEIWTADKTNRLGREHRLRCLQTTWSASVPSLK